MILLNFFFNQGLNALHSFWDVEAYKAFKKCLEFDANNAMVYWGLAKSISQTTAEQKEKKEEAMAMAVKLADMAPPYERDFIKAYDQRSTIGNSAFKEHMEDYLQSYPNQLEPRLFYASSLSTSVRSHSPEGIPTAGNIRGQEILKDILKINPTSSAANHYIIHAIENGPTPEEAIIYADRIFALAPGSGHLAHMPGHIYYRVGDYDKAIKTFYNAMEVDSNYMTNHEMGAINHWNFTHNIDYLVASCAESGRYSEGLRWASFLSKMTLDKSRSMTGGSGYILFGAYSAVPRFYMRFEQWEKAASSIDNLLSNIPWNNSHSVQYLQAIKYYTKSMAQIENGQTQKAIANLKNLKRIRDNLGVERSTLAADWYARYAGKINLVNILEIEALITYRKGNTTQAIRLLKAASIEERNIGYWEPPHYSRPVLESLAWLYTDSGLHNKAMDIFNKVLELRPNSGHAFYGIARGLKIMNSDAKTTKLAYQKFLKYWNNSDDFKNRITEAEQFVLTH